MNAYSRYKNRLERFLQTERGKRFINFAYSIGAAIVILGAMFKLLHFPFGNEMLFIGMMTEVVVFVLSAFDRPMQDYPWEEVFPVLSSRDPDDRPGFSSAAARQTAAMHRRERGYSPEPDRRDRTGKVPRDMHQRDSSKLVSRDDPYAFPGEHEETIRSDFSSRTEEYGRQMENLNRTLSGLNSIYEVQLKSISSQIGTIEQINQGLNRLRVVYSDALPDGTSIKEETGKMADQLKELNEVYGRLLNAMASGRKPSDPWQ